jgi:Fic family protein
LYPLRVDPFMFTSDAWGAVRRTPGGHGYYAFYPAPIARELPLAAKTVALQSKADLALGRLAGAGRILPNTGILLAPYALQESLDSSRIEGTQATLSDVFNANATGDTDRVDIREVLNYRAAMQHGLTSGLPLSKRLLREMHKILLTNVRGREKTPGEFRRSQNWIGSPDNTIDNARFVPPPVSEMHDALDDWEAYQHEEEGLPLLVKCGLLHYQFETIHPFLDGNGRLGRLFITLFLVEKGPLTAPLLYVSSFFEATKQEYYDRLQAVREHGDITGWLDYFLRGVAQQAEDAVKKAERLMDIREEYRGRVQAATRGRAIEVVDLILENPVMTARFVAGRLGVSGQSGLNILRQIEGTGILRSIEPTADGRYRWVCEEILSAVYDGA